MKSLCCLFVRRLKRAKTKKRMQTQNTRTEWHSFGGETESDMVEERGEFTATLTPFSSSSLCPIVPLFSPFSPPIF